MDVLLALLAVLVGLLLNSAGQLLRTKRRPAASQTSGANTALSINGSREPSEGHRRLQRISVADFAEVPAGNEDLILIDLRPTRQNDPLPFRARQVVQLSPSGTCRPAIPDAGPEDRPRNSS